MPTAITSSGITFDDATTQTTSALAAGAIGATQLANGAVTLAKLGTNEQKQVCKAWVNFNGTGTVAIRAEYNVSSITDNGAGDYTVNFTTALADTNYAAVACCRPNAGGGSPHYVFVVEHKDTVVRSETALRIYLLNGVTNVPQDADVVSIAIFR
jgi:hypothetical protein